MSIDAAVLIREAEGATGLADWGGDAFHELFFRQLLGAMVHDLNHEANLTAEGMKAIKLRLEGVLEARLAFVASNRRRPQIAEEQIVAPLFITGLPRSGTTFLHGLLARDVRNFAPRTFEMMFPVPAPAPGADDPRLERTEQILECIGLLRAEIQALHPFGASAPEEDHLMQEILLLGDQFPAYWRLPGYARLRAGLPRGLGWTVHRQVLQTLQNGREAGRVLLKHPGHIFDIGGLLATYPDALIVQTHRDPAKVIPSVAALLVAVRGLGSSIAPDGNKIARVNLGAFQACLDALIELRQDGNVDRHFVDVNFRDLVTEPMATVQRIYQAFDIELTAASRTSMETWLNDPSSKTPKGAHNLAGFGLERAAVDQAFTRYREHFGIAAET
jgi:hypothetical protein